MHQKSPHCDLEYTLAQGLRCASHCTAISNAPLYRVSVVLFSHSTTCRVSVAPVAALQPRTHPYAGLGCATPQTRTQLNPAPPVLRLVRGSARGNGVLARIAGGNGVLTFPGLFIDATATPNYDRYSPMPNHLELMGTYT